MRDEYGGHIDRLYLNVKARYGNAAVLHRIELLVLPKQLSIRQEEELLNQSIALLKKTMLGNNADPSQITEDLNLISYDVENGVSITWQSNMPQYINEGGEVHFLALKTTQKVVLTANLRVGKSSREHRFVVFLVPRPNIDFRSELERSLRLTVSDLNGNQEGEELFLPERNESGVIFEWSLDKKAIPIFWIPVCFFLLLFLYFSSDDTIIKEAKARKAAIEEEMPNLALQLTLLLNAGMVVHAAFGEIILQNNSNEHPLYKILQRIDLQSSQSNESFVRAFYTFSQQSGNRNLIRFMTLVADHETKGSSLAEKLQREGDLLWEGRLQHAKAKAKEAETKLCLPLMLLLLVLVTISIAPALLGM